jgi:3-dehydroquinate dehydratase-1
MSMTITVPRLSDLLHSPTPAIAVSFADQLRDDELSQARAEGLDVFELRIDRYAIKTVEHVLQQVKRFVDVPTIATIRTRSEGGEWDGPDDDRLALFEAIIPFVDGIDIELASTDIASRVVETAKTHGKVVIVSNHNFETTPSAHELLDMARQAKALGADFVKLSAMANSSVDVRTLASFTIDNAKLGLIVIAMGALGTSSRVFFPALGSRLTYAYGNAHPVSGQLTFQQTLEELMRFYPDFNEKKIIELKLLDGS